MRVALISDIHGNLLALEHVLADIRAQGADLVVCLGDVATLGPRPVEVLEQVEALDSPCILGNHDEFLLRPETLAAYSETKVVVEAVQWCQAETASVSARLLSRYQARTRIELGPGVELLLFHGSPDSNVQDLLATTEDEKLDRLLGDQRATVMAGGHTHIQMLRQHRGQLLVNPGSVGSPFREYVERGRPRLEAHAEYAIVGCTQGRVEVNLRRLPLSRRALREQVRGWRSPPPLMWQDQLEQYAD